MVPDDNKLVSNDKTNMYTGIGVGVACFGILAGIGSCGYFLDKGMAEKISAKLMYESKIHQKNVVQGISPETFIEIDGIRYFSTIDGKLLEESDSLSK